LIPVRAHPLVAALLLSASAGCETVTPSTCDISAAGNPTVRYTGGQIQDGVYMTSPWDRGLLLFPSGMHYSLVHGLGRTPSSVQSYLSFDGDGTADGGELAQAAGNQVGILGMDAQTIELSNDSCVEYWLLVTASAGP
jgi:hypothetical protein